MALLKENLERLQQAAKERTVKAVTVEYDLETLVKKINKKVIKLSPDYQRRHRWDNLTASKLIESLILNIPIPFVYISQDIDVDEDVEEDVARYSVIDGQQRLTAITEFFNGDFELDGLDALEPLNGCSYNDLPPFLIRRLEERTIRCLRIDSTLDQQVKFDIFERLNSGSVKLEPQELRNATCRGKFREAINKAANNKNFLKIARIKSDSAKRKKMEDVELILRYFALFHDDGYLEYKGKFKNFLTDRMNYFNTLKPKEISKMIKEFNGVVEIISELNDKPFAKYRSDGDELSKMSDFNAAVYDAVMGLGREALQSGSDIDFDDVVDLFHNQSFFDACQGSVNDASKLVSRIELAKEII